MKILGIDKRKIIKKTLKFERHKNIRKVKNDLKSTEFLYIKDDYLYYNCHKRNSNDPEGIPITIKNFMETYKWKYLDMIDEELKENL